MHFISALIVISLGFSHCFKFFNHRDVLRLQNDVSDINEDAQVTKEWIEQPLDHFNANNRSWKMKYFKRLDFWKPNGPIYLYINGEAPASSMDIETDSLITAQLAKETNGALFASEHRYYGSSRPVVVTDISSMQYLSSKQALADLAELIKFIKSAAEFKLSKVVVVGGSYAGNLAAWMRALYPDLVDAAVSSSGPVLAKKDFYEYIETVSDVYEKYGSTDCLNKIKTIFNHYAELLKTPSGIETLKRELNICDKTDMSAVENQQYFFDDVISVFASHSQYGDPDDIKVHCDNLQRTNWVRSMLKDIKVVHKQFIAQYRRPYTMKNLLQVNGSTRLIPNFSEDCLDYNFTAAIENSKKDKTSMMYSWYYQSCTEFGYFQTTTSEMQPFGHIQPLDYYLKLCHGFFGEDFNEKRVDDGVTQTNAMYGGISPNVTNVVFTHGDMDPWHRLGVLKDLSETAVVKITNGTSHCAILDKADSGQIAKDREYVKNLIKTWIKQG